MEKFLSPDNIFETCLNIDRSGNETHCRVLSHYYCPNTWKYISEQRLLDGKFDCYGEYYNESCQLSKSTYRFQCQSEKKCISWINVLLIVMMQEMKLCFWNKKKKNFFPLKFYAMDIVISILYLLKVLMKRIVKNSHVAIFTVDVIMHRLV
jgi:hypothetical protein